MRRREFLTGSAMVAGSAGHVLGQNPDKAKLDRMAVISWAFDPVIIRPGHSEDPRKTLDLLDFLGMIAERFGIHHVELHSWHFRSTETAYLKELRDRVKKAASQTIQLDLEFGALNISTPDPVVRLETIDLHKRWVDHAVELGCPRVLVYSGTLAPEVRDDAVAALKSIADYARTKKVFVCMENRDGGGRRPAPAAGTAVPAGAAGSPGGSGPAGAAVPGRAGAPGGRGSSGGGAASWELVVEALQAAGGYANPDFGAFPDNEARWAGLKAMYRMTAGNSHVKYNPAVFSVADGFKISKDAGYTGLYCIESGGRDPYAEVQIIRDELLKLL